MDSNRDRRDSGAKVRDIDEYLDLLYIRLRTTPREARHILAEADDHLREAVTDGLAAGMTEREAHQAAISSFGSVRAVARAHNARHRFPDIAVLRDLVLSAWKLGSFGLLAVGASGLVVVAMNRVFGPQLVGGSPVGWRASAAACRRWLELWPDVHSCAQAAVLENSSDAVSLRLVAGIFGLLLLALYLVLRLRQYRPAGVLPDGFVPTIAVSLFGAATIGLSLLSVSASTAHPIIPGNGPGYYASGAIVSLAMAVAYLWPRRRTLLRHATG